ncbi:MAG TPA: hypothetical protein VHE37_15835 [Nevskiaceae bacterium]|nr:hypothetical protein [Nevskiaceae bacterium]
MAVAREIFINLPVKDLDKSVAFFRAVGLSLDPRFGDGMNCLVVGDSIRAMLMSHEQFAAVMPGPLADVSRPAALRLSLENRAAIEALMEKALAAGGRRYEPAQDHGFMYEDGFLDLDGHHWSLFHLDYAAFDRARREQAA